jgi:hypothetical protein
LTQLLWLLWLHPLLMPLALPLPLVQMLRQLLVWRYSRLQPTPSSQRHLQVRGQLTTTLRLTRRWHVFLLKATQLCCHGSKTKRAQMSSQPCFAAGQ